jgi:DNA-binding HxlR family transcriptional regulator
MPALRKSATPDSFGDYPGAALVISLLADKWTIPVIHSLARGTKRTGELKSALTGVSQKMLTQTLRALEGHGLISREVFPVVPPRVEYSLTELGESINVPLMHICEWTAQNGRKLERVIARTRAKR